MVSSPIQKLSSDTIAPTRTLAQFVARSSWNDIPALVRREATRAFLNWVGCAHGGASHDCVGRALAGVVALGGQGTCRVIGRDNRLDPMGAALINGLSVGLHAYDDAHIQTVIHPAAPTVASLLAHAELHPVTGTDFLHALVLSHEIQSRLSCALAVAPARCHVGHYMTGLIGAIGVAAALGKLMELSEQQLVWAMGLAAMQGAGFRSSHATMAAPLIPANAGRNGLLAAHLAAQGFTCRDEPLTSPNGLLSVVGAPANPTVITEDLGLHWECMNVAIKPFPNGCLIHAATDVCLEITRMADFAADDIERLDIHVHPMSLSLTGRRDPHDAFEAQVSLYHWAAAALLHQRAGLREATDACVADPAIVALSARIHGHVADDLCADEARATLVLRDGRELRAEVRPHVGSAKRPLDDARLETKFLEQVEAVIDPLQARSLARICWQIQNTPDVGRAAPMAWGGAR
jgi:2-methylcitrate dehydratase PrpD